MLTHILGFIFNEGYEFSSYTIYQMKLINKNIHDLMLKHRNIVCSDVHHNSTESSWLWMYTEQHYYVKSQEDIPKIKADKITLHTDLKGDLVIPSHIKNLTMTLYDAHNELTSLTLPDGLEKFTCTTVNST